MRLALFYSPALLLRLLTTVCEQNGEITDPPAQTSAVDVRYGQPRQQPTLPFVTTAPNTDDGANLFCQTCLKNQHLLTQSLAQFYPSPTNENFPAYETAEAEYRESLQDRYPQVCERCEPRVRERLQKVNYNAKADHLGRVMQRLGGRRVVEEPWWKRWGVFWLGVMWAVSWLAELGWHVLGLFNEGGYGSVTPLTPTLKYCFTNTFEEYEITPACLAQVREGPVYFALCMGLFSACWHPKLREKLEKRYAKLVGLKDYYKIHFLALAVRWLAWYWMDGMNLPDVRLYRPIHLFLLTFSIISIISSYKAVSTDYTPKVSFKESPEPLIRNRNRNRNRNAVDKEANTSTQSRQPSLFRGNQPIIQPRPFSINDLAPPTTPPSAPRLPTPPPEVDYDDEEAMDWTPSHPPLRPDNTNRILPSPLRYSGQEEPSPFHGTLPASIVSPAHRLRNPPNQPTFRAASAAKKQTLFPKQSAASKSIKAPSTGHPLDLTSLGMSLAPSTTSVHQEGEGSPSKTVFSDHSPVKFARPRFFPQKDYETDTGLEGLLANSFTLDEAPAEVHAARQQTQLARQREQQALSAKRSVKVRAGFMLIVMLVVGIWWVKACYVVEGGIQRGGKRVDGTLYDALAQYLKGAIRGFLAI